MDMADLQYWRQVERVKKGLLPRTQAHEQPTPPGPLFCTVLRQNLLATT